MKWKNKGCEFDELAKKYIDIFELKNSCIYIFGAGLWGEKYAPVFEYYNCFGGYIDNDRKKQLSGVNGRKVFSLHTYIKNIKEGIIVIAVDNKNIPFIENQLKAEGLKNRVDFWVYQDFVQSMFPILSFYVYNSLYVDFVQICLTERCTLRCIDCAHGCFAVGSNSCDMDLDMAKKSADYLFSKADFINEFVLIGGEPFLYNNLVELIPYIGERYRNKMMMYSITTNGTIVPDEIILQLCKKYEITIHISNYSETIEHLRENYVRLSECLKQHEIAYTISAPEQQWMDYGFKSVDRGGIGLMEVFDRCKTPCREIRGSKYYYCVMARSVSENLEFNVGREDYLELADLNENEKKIFLEFNLGYSKKGYLDMCNYCNGADAIHYPIPAAVQMS